MRILITCPHLYLRGGVSNYYGVIKKYLPVEADFVEVGARKEGEGRLAKPLHLLSDCKKLGHQLNRRQEKYNLVHINPSFNFASLLRDGLLLRIAKKSGTKTLVFFRGINRHNIGFTEQHFFRPFFRGYDKADGFIVLSSEFKDKMRDWGFKQRIFEETTLVDDEYLRDFSIEKRIRRAQSHKPTRLLFLSRILREKGICETIQAVRKLREKRHDICLTVAGDGPFFNEARQFARTVGAAESVSFLGYVKGQQKKGLLVNSDIFVFPSYSEGMPNSVLEAMAFGLPVVTRPVGGIKDFFMNGEHGYMTESKDPEIIATLIERIMTDRALMTKMSRTVHEYAKKRFMASSVAERLTDIYKTMMRPESSIQRALE